MKKKKIKKFLLIVGGVIAAFILFFVISNLAVIGYGRKRIATDEELASFNADCILILGAGVWDGNVPSPMLADRLDEGIRLYREGIADKILVSGDHGQSDYDEVNVMKKYLMDAGIKDSDIFMDHAGFSTYESMYRAKSVFGVERTVVITQEYHMHRALFICKQLGIEALGSNADPRIYAGNLLRNVREWVARDKDMLWCMFKIKPQYIGEPIDIHGDGSITNDK